MAAKVIDEKKGAFIKKAYLDGYSPLEISAAIGHAPDTIRRYMKANKIRRPDLKHEKVIKMTPEDTKWALEMWNLGYPKRQIANALGVTQGMVQCRTYKEWKNKPELVYEKSV